MFVRQKYIWQLDMMFGDQINKSIEVGFIGMQPNQRYEFSIPVEQAEWFYEELGKRIQHAKTGTYSG